MVWVELQGRDGREGRDGRDGRDGQDGVPGPHGPQGQRGVAGAAGPQGPPVPRNGGVVSTRWGETSYPSISLTQLMYAGRAGGTDHTHKGRSSQHLYASRLSPLSIHDVTIVLH